MWKNFNKTDRRILATASLLLILMLYFLYDDSLLLPSDDTKNLTPIGKLEDINQDVRRKISKQFTWRSARGQETVHVGDSLFTGKDSTAVVTLKDGRKLTVEPNSLIVFNTNGDQLNLDLRFGRIAGNIEGCLKINVKGVMKEVCGNNSNIAIDSEGEVKTETAAKELISWVQLPANPFFHSNNNIPLKVSWKAHQHFSRFQVQISRQKDFKKLVMQERTKTQSIETKRYPLEGQFFIRIQGDDLKGRPSGFSKTEAIEIKKVPLLAITHPTPKQKFSYRTNADGELIDRNQFDVRWNYPLKNVRFEMEISRDAEFTQIVNKTANLQGPVIAVTNLPKGTYHARIRDMTVTNGLNRPWSPAVPFEIDILAPARLPSPNLLTKNIRHLAPSEDPVVVKWTDVIEADQYVVETSTKPDFSEKKTFKTIDPGLTVSELEPGKTFFRVYSATEKGTLGDPSPVGSLDVAVKEPVLAPVENIDIMGKTPEDPGDPQELQASWTDLKLAKSYLVQVSENSKFENPVEFKTEQPSGKIVLPKPGNYHWRVQGLDKDGQPVTKFSQSSQVNYNLRVPLATPGLQEPLDQMTLFFQKNLSPYVWFEWQPVRQAIEYKLEISQDPNFESKILTIVSKTPRYLVKDKLPDGPLYWRVQAQGDDQRISHWSPARAMKVMSGRAPAGRKPAEGRK